MAAGGAKKGTPRKKTSMSHYLLVNNYIHEYRSGSGLNIFHTVLDTCMYTVNIKWESGQDQISVTWFLLL